MFIMHCPPRCCAGKQSGTLELSIPATGEKNIYTLLGTAAEPAAECNIVIDCKVRRLPVMREGVTERLPVSNVGWGKEHLYAQRICSEGNLVDNIKVGTTGMEKVSQIDPSSC